ncbi:General secretion pathway protein D / Type II secretion outermembrane pore forming protein (PulD) [hydrothermal vent metagenome]|uniref:General secretion pathway protein D / Type II secretion outermembrane pore forming protein (PulD) n=1 Tax=hydrothermal vent metagenome TaxID=652676 RepID=A0A1W1BG82_9ZZZZ
MRLSRLVLSLIFILSINLYAIDEDRVDVNFNDLTTKDFIIMVGKITGKNILITDDLKGKINFISTKPIKKSSLIPLANSILANKGYTLVDQGDYYQVVKTNDAAGEGLVVDTKVGNAEVMKTVLFRLKYSNASVIRAKIKPLLHKNAKIISFKKNNIISVTATPKTLKAIKNVIDTIEANSDKKSIFIKLKYADIKDVYTNAVAMSRKLFPKGIESEEVNIFKDDATNSIILIGKNKNMHKMVKYIKKLDVKGDKTTQQMFVIPLKNSNVEDMQKIISQLVNQMNGMIPLAAKGAKKATKAMVVSDLERNALVVLADGNQIKNIRSTIKKLDVPKPQVYVKVKIVEINTDLASQIGLRYGFEMGKITSQGLFTLAGNAGADSLMISQNLLGFLNTDTTQYDQNGNLVTTTDRAFSFDSGISEMFALGAKLDLMKQNGAAHILSEPSVLCINNKEASIYIGRTQSIMTQAQQSTQGQGNIINNYSREDIGITLKVKPRLSSNNTVSLEVKATIEDVLPNSGANVDRPTTTKRDVLTNAIVNNGETIILGGLIKNSAGKSVTSVPILGDIPVLGELFKSRGNVIRKINVVVYLTPFIVRKSSDLKRLRSALVELEDIQSQYNHFIMKALESKKTKKWYDFGGTPSDRISSDESNLNLNYSGAGHHPAANRTRANSTDGIFTIGD